MDLNSLAKDGFEIIKKLKEYLDVDKSLEKNRENCLTEEWEEELNKHQDESFVNTGSYFGVAKHLMQLLFSLHESISILECADHNTEYAIKLLEDEMIHHLETALKIAFIAGTKGDLSKK